MKQYVVDELRPADHQKIKGYLDANFPAKGFEDLYWIPLDREQLTDIQNEHTACQPFYFALELLPDRLACELLVRTQQRVRCHCIQYATERQRDWLIQIVEAIFDRLEIIA